MKKLVMLFMLLICTAAHAEEKVRVYTDYAPVRILYKVEGTNFDNEAAKSGLTGQFKEIPVSALPSDRSDREFWVLDSGVVKVMKTKKDQAMAKKAKREADKVAAIAKLGLTEDELEAIGLKER